MNHIKLGILNAAPAQYHLPDEKTEPEKFADLFSAVAAPFSYETWDATEGDLPASTSDCDAYLVTGSPCGANDEAEWIRDLGRFVLDAREDARTLVGICFGHQLIARTLGGLVARAERGWMLGLHDIHLKGDKDWIGDEAGPQPLYFVNQDQVTQLPTGAELLAGSDACPNAMFAVGHGVLGLQAHPEQPRESIRAFAQRLLELGRIEEQEYVAAVASLGRSEAQGLKVARWITRFVLASRK